MLESPENRIDGFSFSDLGIILAGSWVDNEYILSMYRQNEIECYRP